MESKGSVDIEEDLQHEIYKSKQKDKGALNIYR
jgi:hypothetical protein